MIELKLFGRIPSKKNSVNIFTRNGRIFKTPSTAYQNWHKESSLQLLGKIPKNPIEKASILITIFAPDKRKADLTNKAESLMDLLVDNRILIDDNWFICHEIKLKFGGVDRKNPRAEIIING